MVQEAFITSTLPIFKMQQQFKASNALSLCLFHASFSLSLEEGENINCFKNLKPTFIPRQRSLHLLQLVFIPANWTIPKGIQKNAHPTEHFRNIPCPYILLETLLRKISPENETIKHQPISSCISISSANKKIYRIHFSKQIKNN